MSETPRQRELRLKREWYYRNRDKILASQRQYGKRNRARILAKALAWYKKNKARKKAYDIARRQTKKARDSHRIASREYARRNPDKCRAWSISHPKELNEIRKRWAKNNPDKLKAACGRRRARILGVKRDKTAELFYSFVRSKRRIPCYYCGTIMSGASAHIDHIVALSKSGNHASDNLCASCHTCNLKKSAKTILDLNKAREQPLLNL